MFVLLLFLCFSFLSQAMNTDIYQITKQVTFPSDINRTGIATLLAAKNALCVAQGDHEIAVYDTAAYVSDTVVSFPVHDYPCIFESPLQSLSPMEYVTHVQCAEGNLCTQEQYYDFKDRFPTLPSKRDVASYSSSKSDSYSDSDSDSDDDKIKRQSSPSKNVHSTCSKCGYQASITNPDVERHRIQMPLFLMSHSHTRMKPSAMASNRQGTLICVAKNIHNCSAIEVHSVAGESADSLTLKRSTHLGNHKSAVTDIAYLPGHCCVSISNDAIKEWDMLTGKEIRISPQEVRVPTSIFTSQAPRSSAYTYLTPYNSIKRKKETIKAFSAPYGNNGCLLPMGNNVLVAASHDEKNYVGEIDMRIKKMLCHQTIINSSRINDIAESSSSEHQYLVGGIERIKEYDKRMRASDGSCKVFHEFEIEFNLKFFSTIQAVTSYKNFIVAAITQESIIQKYGTHVYIWDVAKPNPISRTFNFSNQKIKLSDSIESKIQIIPCQDGKLLITDNSGITELSLVS